MKKYIFSEKVGKKTTKYEIVAETLEEAQLQLTEKLETERGTPLLSVGLPDYIEPIDPPTDVTLKTFNITFRPDPDNHEETETITYKATSMNSAEGQFLEDYPDQAGHYRETHSPLSNYAVDRENEEKESRTDKPADKLPILGFFDNVFTQVIDWAKLITMLLLALIGLDLVASVLFGVENGFGVVNNINNLLTEFKGLSGLVVLFIVYFLFIKNGKAKEKT